ncbi:hypothetical protein D7T48_12095 [Stenotrophomonas maltophilia]|uniref:hypothetical protein n=1 Tax=Stenotrophomonas maltophilia TaxID=40324 RepID=UPI0015DDA367|nr:hypothetical protein [Stenotrophomonas maltophilia]MBA0277530.1 hypothetical protein [Stenotrophomonas maltophilia]MBA0413003.1 hypothetical protein [Stenotrophomonas maltophilia]MBA0498691.1 hypothetical protein [Stenotrophomonas maltophilia]MBA0502815.1 hypothetical protein [Stenotrophomonas maltophilia]MBA0507716.1 hypothetical protein [Stenotrophomonas maltophilia]
MDAIEKRARQLLDAELRKVGLHEDAYHVGCGADVDRNDQAAINAISAAITPPDGYVLVPVVPTKQMMDAAVPASSQDQTGRRQRATWDAMLAVRPEVP